MRPRNASCSFCRKSYHDVGPLVEGPDNVFICGECVELCQHIVKQVRRRRSRNDPQLVPPFTPEVILKKLHELFSGQDKAKEQLAAAVHHHYGSLSQLLAGPVGERRNESCILLVGPTRSSKIFLARALAHALGVPFAHGEATSLVQTDSGNQGGELLLYQLLVASDFDIEAAQRGMVYIDGVDQPEAQEHLRRLLERTVRHVPLQSGRKHPAQQSIQIDTNNILCLCGGTFPGLAQATVRGGRHPEQPVTGDDLIAWGLSAQMVRRATAIVEVAPLDEETLLCLVSGVNFVEMTTCQGQ